MCGHLLTKCEFSWCEFAMDPNTHLPEPCIYPWCVDCKRWSVVPKNTMYCSYCLLTPTKPHVHNGISVVGTDTNCVNNCPSRLCSKCNPKQLSYEFNYTCKGCGCYIGDAQCQCMKCLAQMNPTIPTTSSITSTSVKRSYESAFRNDPMTVSPAKRAYHPNQSHAAAAAANLYRTYPYQQM